MISLDGDFLLNLSNEVFLSIDPKMLVVDWEIHAENNKSNIVEKYILSILRRNYLSLLPLAPLPYICRIGPSESCALPTDR